MNTTFKQFFFKSCTIISLISLTACATTKKQEVIEPIMVAQPVIVPETQWQNWNLVVVSLDKNKKPSEKTEVSLLKPVKLTKAKAPEITVEEIPSSEGRLVRIKCEDNVASQKFDSTEQLKGWAIQMSCYKQTYYFIINQIGLNNQN